MTAPPAAPPTEVIKLAIATTWEGHPLPEGPVATVTLAWSSEALVITIEARAWGDPPPPPLCASPGTSPTTPGTSPTTPDTSPTTPGTSPTTPGTSPHPEPTAPPGRRDRLWEHEVVEVFLAEAPTATSPYLELEFGPHGHWLALAFSGYRHLVDAFVPMTVPTFHPSVSAFPPSSVQHWSATARVDRATLATYLPNGISAVNAYAIHGAPPHRHYLAAAPTPEGHQAAPDFHRTIYFTRIIPIIP